MRTDQLINLLPTQFRRVHPTNPLYSGHSIPLLGYWTKDDGYVKKTSLIYNDGTLACPVIAVVTKKFGSSNVTLRITAKESIQSGTSTETHGDSTYTRKTYEHSGSIYGTLTIPRHTRQWATFLVTGLGQMVYEITSITDNVTYDTGKVEFYALASSGSKLIYWFGIHKLAEQIREIGRPWIAPTKCTRCSGTGIEPYTEDGVCNQCEGYKYSGWASNKYVQRMQGFDVGLARDLIDNWEEMSVAEHTAVFKFINKCWTQKWWVTPTVTEIKRLFAHFYNMEKESVYIKERFNAQEPIWYLDLPSKGETGSPFGVDDFDSDDKALLKYIAESITPAGVSVFVGFYSEWEVGDFDDFTDEVMHHIRLESSIEPILVLDGCGRWDFHNGWTEATVDFEGVTIPMDIVGSVELINVNDQNRHMVRLSGTSSVGTGVSATPSGMFELWVHPYDSAIRMGFENSGDWICYVEYDTDGFYDHYGNLLTSASTDCDYHVKVKYVLEAGSGLVDYYINRNLLGTDVEFLIHSLPDNFKVQNIGIGEGFIDAIGLFTDVNYTENDNWQRIHLWGWGRQHLNDISGITNLLENYFENDKFFVI